MNLKRSPNVKVYQTNSPMKIKPRRGSKHSSSPRNSSTNKGKNRRESRFKVNQMKKSQFSFLPIPDHGDKSITKTSDFYAKLKKLNFGEASNLEMAIPKDVLKVRNLNKNPQRSSTMGNPITPK